ncbi:MAG TPA: general secretion pathway protein [Flavobacterium sp.]|uniref:general secretion pathway protein n=1 Tax=unclassified Flavobacterium TaxID=196869 RepID=UPI000E8BDADB|nr:MULTISPECIES: general secretion pathway protein [unclassified Flavobacterium]HBI02252.1 general secretion pathway protein [Flavobacterium sp.]HRE76415.1 general secretion pathway protein [Flavobacterium sp.]
MSGLKSFLLGNTFLGIELFTRNGKDCFDVVEVRKKKNDLVIANQQQVEKLEEINKTDFPVYLAINTSQVLYKEVESTDSNDLKLVQKAFPNLSMDDFCFEIWRLESKSLVFICRKEYVNSIIKNCNKQHIKLFGFSLGLASLAQVAPFLKESIVSTNSFRIDFASEDKLLSTPSDRNNEKYTINGLVVNNTSLVSFSSALSVLLNGNNNSGNVSSENTMVADNYYQTAFFSKGFKVMIGFVLSVLLLNFFVFNHYFKKGQEVSESLAINKSSIERIKNLKEEIKNKEERVKSFSVSNATKSSLILNEIARSVPSSVLLDNLVYNPLQKRVKPNEQILTDSNTLLISGSSIDKAEFTSWITYLETLSWISSVSIVHYGNEDGKGASFEIKLLWQDEIK